MKLFSLLYADKNKSILKKNHLWLFNILYIGILEMINDLSLRLFTQDSDQITIGKWLKKYGNAKI